MGPDEPKFYRQDQMQIDVIKRDNKAALDKMNAVFELVNLGMSAFNSQGTRTR